MSEADLCKIYAHTCTLGGLFVPGWQYIVLIILNLAPDIYVEALAAGGGM